MFLRPDLYGIVIYWNHGGDVCSVNDTDAIHESWYYFIFFNISDGVSSKEGGLIISFVERLHKLRLFVAIDILLTRVIAWYSFWVVS